MRRRGGKAHFLGRVRLQNRLVSRLLSTPALHRSRVGLGMVELVATGERETDWNRVSSGVEVIDSDFQTRGGESGTAQPEDVEAFVVRIITPFEPNAAEVVLGDYKPGGCVDLHRFGWKHGQRGKWISGEVNPIGERP